MFDIHDRNRRWEWRYFAQRRDERRAYIAAFKAWKVKDKVVHMSLFRFAFFVLFY
ncbi:hypothetical protein ABTO87_18445 [Acinetobacter baumannii]